MNPLTWLKFAGWLPVQQIQLQGGHIVDVLSCFHFCLSLGLFNPDQAKKRYTVMLAVFFFSCSVVFLSEPVMVRGGTNLMCYAAVWPCREREKERQSPPELWALPAQLTHLSASAYAVSEAYCMQADNTSVTNSPLVGPTWLYFTWSEGFDVVSQTSVTGCVIQQYFLLKQGQIVCILFPPVPLPPPQPPPPHLISITMGRHRVESWPRPPLHPRASLTVSLSSSSLVCPPSRTPQDSLLLAGSPFLSALLSRLYPHSSGCIPIITSLPLSPSSLTISKLLSCGSHLSCFFLSLPSPLPSVLYFLFFFSLEQSGVT